MSTNDPRELALLQLDESNAILHTIDQVPPTRTDLQAYIATYSQAHATRAVAFALLDVADAIREAAGSDTD